MPGGPRGHRPEASRSQPRSAAACQGRAAAHRARSAWSMGRRLAIASAASLSQGHHDPLALSHSGQSHRTWTSSSCAAAQWGHAELVGMPWPDIVAAVHMAQAMGPRSSDFSNSVEAARSAARHARPSAPSPSALKATGRRASSYHEEWQGPSHI